MQTRTGYLYCAACDDFIYTNWLDKIRVSIHDEFEGMMKRYTVTAATPLTDNFPARKKRKQELETRKQLKMSSSNPRIVFSEPKGVYNLGQSCYLSVILQAMAHNPHVTAYFLQNEHKPRHCASDSCIACALSDSLKQLLITEGREGHAPVGLLYRTWLKNTVSWPSLLLPWKQSLSP